jgi:acetolactate synthase-1/3 small subunit
MSDITPLSAPILRVRPAPRKHTLVVQLHDRPGALYRAIGLIRRRDYNVSSLVVGASERPGTSRMVLVVEAVDVHQVLQQLTRLVDVVSVAEIGRGDALVRETALAVVEVADARAHAEVERVASETGARITDRAHSRL